MGRLFVKDYGQSSVFDSDLNRLTDPKLLGNPRVRLKFQGVLRCSVDLVITGVKFRPLWLRFTWTISGVSYPRFVPSRLDGRWCTSVKIPLPRLRRFYLRRTWRRTRSGRGRDSCRSRPIRSQGGGVLRWRTETRSYSDECDYEDREAYATFGVKVIFYIKDYYTSIFWIFYTFSSFIF